MAFQQRDVRADGNGAAIARPALVDLQPALVGKLHFGGNRVARAVRIGYPPLDHGTGCGCNTAERSVPGIRTLSGSP